jgi:hypothetical protein
MDLNMEQFKGDRGSQDNLGPLHKMSKTSFRGSMNPRHLVPTQSHTDDSRVAQLAAEIKTQGMKTPIKVDYTHEKGSEGTPQAFVGDGHHHLRAALQAGMDTVPVEGNAYHGYAPPEGTG